MRIDLPNNKSAWLIGDPHLGRKFEAGVPAHKRGQREARQLTILRDELHISNVDFNISVGDLFDHPHVGYKVALEVAELYLKAAEALPNTNFYVMAGNHDLPRNLGVVGAFDAFEEIVAGRFPNLIVVRRATQVSPFLALFPWEWNKSAAEQVVEIGSPLDDDFNRGVAVGHWDLQSYGGDDTHMAPTSMLHVKGWTQLYSGHYHTEGDYTVNGHVVHCTGSMEPYSHGEDPEGKIYVTLTLDEATDGRDLSEKCVRVILSEGEELPDDLDCMAITAIKAKVENEEVQPINLGKFEWKTVLDEALADLDPEVRSFIEERLSA